ncbi:hypothetical protein TRVA0_049S00826 [Trichomonascus vanleenenianus]|uniref:uncharacterized protein n=1 Tax=Trichomonascus vanleenenianus TaxID=2268995 RepID=UPI003ECB1FEF
MLALRPFRPVKPEILRVAVGIYTHNRLFSQSRVVSTRVENTNRDILKLVPNRGKATIITKDGERLANMPIKKFLYKLNVKEDKLVVVSVKQDDRQDTDPALICKVVPLEKKNTPSSSTKEWQQEEKKAKKKPTAQKEKNVPISWTIGKADLQGQKRAAIESVLSRGHKAIIQLGSKGRGRTKPPASPLEVESRNKLVEQVRHLCEEELGAQEYSKPEGSINGDMTLYYSTV